MYNYDYNLTYKTNDNETSYRKDFLSVFNIKEFDWEIINTKQTTIFNKIKNDNIFKKIIKLFKTKANPWPIPLNDIDAFVLMFSFDYFYLTHEIIIDFNKNNTLSDTFLKKFNDLFD
jgi:hypothetical protein